MSKRLYMTNADYVAIAISPALIMALVGSLVYFLIEVLYVGQYQARLNYAFALFVFAAVLIARISIEMGSERAALFALPLGIAMFLFLVRFVEQPSPLSHLINLALMFVVWWCAHRLTWDSTVIDDDEDASGEGLMQRVGVDGPTAGEQKGEMPNAATAGAKDNELFAAENAPSSRALQWWQRFVRQRRGPHTPGLWVLYFSLAALPLFGIGQHWIPVADVGRRRYVFGLLMVYVAAALSLLVTTSFLNLRRYLRQRRVEMPTSIVGTWVGVGAVLIVVVMVLAALIPRPGAEIAMSRVPWQAGSPGGMSASRISVNRDGGEQQNEQHNSASGDASADQPPQDGQQKNGGESGQSDPSGQPGDAQKNATSTPDNSQAQSGKSEAADGGGKSDGRGESGQSKGQSKSETAQHPNSGSPPERNNSSTEQPKQPDGNPNSSSSQPSHALSAIQIVSSSLGGLAGVLKILFYVIAALFVAYGIWKYRRQILQALADILQQLRQLFGSQPTNSVGDEKDASAAAKRVRTFAEFRDPFLTGQHSQLPPEELVRYTFAAFEAWTNDRGRPRQPDCTPQELVRLALAPDAPMYADARRLTRLYSEVAYASARIPRESANELRGLWQMMRDAHANEFTGAI